MLIRPFLFRRPILNVPVPARNTDHCTGVIVVSNTIILHTAAVIVMLVNALRGAAMNLQTRKKAPRSVCMCLGVRLPGNAFPEISPHVEIQKIYLCTFVDSPDYTWYQVRSMSFKSITAVFIFLQCGVSYRALSGQFNLIPQIPCFSAVFWHLIPSFVLFLCHPIPAILLILIVLNPTSSELWICRQSTVYSIVDLIHRNWLCTGTSTFEIIVANHSPIRCFIRVVLFFLAPFRNSVDNQSPIRYFTCVVLFC